MSKLLLVSSSRFHGTKYLEHCREAISSHFSGIGEVLFVPYALADHAEYERIAAGPFAELGIKLTSIHRAADPVAAVASARGMFVGGGNSFRLLKTLYDLDLIDAIKNGVNGDQLAYMGASAGTNMACPTIRTTNDMPIVEPPSLNALGLIPFQINPHFLDAEPNSKHKGETRAQRLAEYHEENSGPVAAIREGSWFSVTDSNCQLDGHTGMVLFQKDSEPQEIAAPADISFLMK